MKTKTNLRKTAVVGLAALVLGGTIFGTYRRKMQEENQRAAQEEKAQEAQEGLLAVDRYIMAMENPESLDGFYSLGWNMQVPDKYKEVVRKYKPSSGI